MSINLQRGMTLLIICMIIILRNIFNLKNVFEKTQVFDKFQEIFLKKIKISFIIFFKETFIRDFLRNIHTENAFIKNILNRNTNAL